MYLLCRLLSALVFAIFAVAAQAASVLLNTASGTTVTANISPDAVDIGKSVNVWMGAVFQGALYLRSGTTWTPYASGAFPVAISGQTLFPSTPVTVVDGLDISAFAGLEIYVGYGVSEQDMLSSPGKLSKIHTVPARAAQTVSISKNVNYSQTSATDMVENPRYSFCVDVDGLPVTSTPPIFSGPVNVAAVGSWYNGGKLVWNANDRCKGTQAGWGGGTTGNDWGSPTLADLNSKFGSGTYTVVAGGTSYSLPLTGDAYANPPPRLILGGGAWSNGKYVINPASALTITTSAFAAYGSHADDEIGLGVLRADYVARTLSIVAGTNQYYSAVPGSNSVTYTLPPLTLASGQDYLVAVSFTAIVARQGSLNSDSYGTAGYQTVTLATLSADSTAPLDVGR